MIDAKPKSGGRPRVLYVVSHPIQYQAPLLKYLAASGEIELHTWFLSDFSLRTYQDTGFGQEIRWDVPLLEGYSHEFIGARGAVQEPTFWRPWPWGLLRRLRDGRFDAVWLHGYSHNVQLRLIAVAKMAGVPVLVRGESHAFSSARAGAGRWLRAQLLPLLFRTIDGMLAIGSLNAQYYESHGVEPEKIFRVPYAVDNSWFRSRCLLAGEERAQFRASLGLLDSRPVILYASKLQRRKRPSDLIEAYARLSPDGRQEPSAYLVFVGDGEERPALEERARALGWSSIRFAGFQGQVALPRYFDLCDVFVLPCEHEPWGLVVNEVMAAGRPVIVGCGAGCAADLVEEGANGFLHKPGDIEGLADRLRLLVDDEALRERMGRASAEKISQWSYREDLAGLCEALQHVCQKRQ